MFACWIRSEVQICVNRRPAAPDNRQLLLLLDVIEFFVCLVLTEYVQNCERHVGIQRFRNVIIMIVLSLTINQLARLFCHLRKSGVIWFLLMDDDHLKLATS